MSEAAKQALYQIADRLCRALLAYEIEGEK